MAKFISQENFSNQVLVLLNETFETHYGIYLDKDTSLIPTLNQISAAEASIPVGGGCATIAAQVEHVIFYLNVLERYTSGEDVGKIDWGEIWGRVKGVSDSEWDELRGRLFSTYTRISDVLKGIEDWNRENAIGGALAILTHTAYHLGEIRQALCTIARES